MPTLFFTDGNDSYTVTAAGSYSLVFLDGNDALTVNGGTFTTGVMGEGADVITLQSGDALIYGDGGNDRFEIFGSGFEARGGSNDDSFNIRGGDHLVLRGDTGNDLFTFLHASLDMTARGGGGDDFFDGGGKIVTGNILGDGGNDTFVGFRNAGGQMSNLRGGPGNDLYLADPAAPANFIENSGEGIDTVQVARGHSYTLPVNIENLIAGTFDGSMAGSPMLVGNGSANLIQGSSNNETIKGLTGNDSLYGGYGNDTLGGGSGNDLLDGQAGDDSMAGSTGNDTYFVNSLADVVTESPGEGTDVVHVSVYGYTLAANVENGTIDSAGGLALTGNSLANVLTGNDGIDFLTGGLGSDHLYGGLSTDHMSGGNGDDTLDGQAGEDTMAGGAGNDRYYVDTQSDAVFENPGEGIDTVVLSGSPGSGLFSYVLPGDVENIVILSSLNLIQGNDLANSITGSAGDDDIWGMGGNDTITGGGGDDVIFGRGGADTILGGTGADFIQGDWTSPEDFAGDTLTGGGGADRFQYKFVDESAPFIGRVDTITDFQTGLDTIGLDADANANVDGNQQWVLVDASTGAAGELWIDSSDAANGNYVVFGDDDGDGLADLMIRVHATTTFSVSDILL